MTTFTLPHQVSPAASIAGTRWQALVGAVLVQLILGTIYGYSVFWQPLESELWPVTAAQVDDGIALTEPGSAAAALATGSFEAARQASHLKFAFGICLVSFATAMVFAGRLQDIRGPRFTSILGGLILGLGFVIAGQMQSLATVYVCHALLIGTLAVVALLAFDALFGKLDAHEYPIVKYVPYGIMTSAIIAGIVLANHFITGDVKDRVGLLWATIGLLAGVGIGYAYVGPLAALMKWFPNHKGLVCGIAVGGFGLGAYLFSSHTAIGAAGFIQRHDMSTFFTVHGLISAVVVTLGGMLLCNPPGMEPAGLKPSALLDNGMDWHTLLRSRTFHLVWLMFFSGAVAGIMVLSILKAFAGDHIVHGAIGEQAMVGRTEYNQLLLRGAEAVGFFLLYNAIGRVAWGAISDRLGRTPALVSLFLIQGIALMAMPAMKSEWLLLIGAACVGLTFGGSFALFPSLTADLFGARHFGANYGWVFTSYGAAGVVGIWAGSAALTLTGDYGPAFYFAAILSFASAALALAVRREHARVSV